MSARKNNSLSILNGQSMFPTLRHGDKILTRKIAPAELKKRDIIVFQSGSLYLCHRIVGIIASAGNLKFRTQGDFNLGSEEVSSVRVIGKVIGMYRCGRPRFLTYEHTLLYYLSARFICQGKEIAKQFIENLCTFYFIRRLIKTILPLKVEYAFIPDIRENRDFKSFSNSYSLLDSGEVLSGFLVSCRGVPVAKLLLSEDPAGNHFLFGPYVRLFYRGRDLENGLISQAVQFLRKKTQSGRLYVPAYTDLKLRQYFKEAGFWFDEKVPLGQASEFFELLPLKANK